MFTLTQDSDVFLVEAEGGMTRDEAEQLGHKLLRLVDADPAEQIAAWLEEHERSLDVVDRSLMDECDSEDGESSYLVPSMGKIAAAIREGRWRK